MNLIGLPSWAGCPRCGGLSPDEANSDVVCQCGSGDRLGAQAWEWIQQQLLVRSGGTCEARTPWCLASRQTGSLAQLPRGRVSIHHRRPRGMGGTRRADAHALHNLMLLCGTGVVGCHGWTETERTAARQRGLLVHQDADPATVPVVLASGRVVLLDRHGPWMLDPAGVPRWLDTVPGQAA
ncbi:HNH endonuclease [Micromonospora haikouensis]|uniref:HNH endonuclease n=1 Tax=Micromonospora haikouensis TaxID=686309 RepID=UPI003D72A38A